MTNLTSGGMLPLLGVYSPRGVLPQAMCIRLMEGCFPSVFPKPHHV